MIVIPFYHYYNYYYYYLFLRELNLRLCFFSDLSNNNIAQLPSKVFSKLTILNHL